MKHPIAVGAKSITALARSPDGRVRGAGKIYADANLSVVVFNLQQLTSLQILLDIILHVYGLNNRRSLNPFLSCFLSLVAIRQNLNSSLLTLLHVKVPRGSESAGSDQHLHHLPTDTHIPFTFLSLGRCGPSVISALYNSGNHHLNKQ